MVISRVRLIRVRLVLVNLNPINDTYIHLCNPERHPITLMQLESK